MRDENVANLHLPMVMIDCRMPDIEADSVVIENIEAAYKIVEHLINDGYQRSGAILGGDSTTAKAVPRPGRPKG